MKMRPSLKRKLMRTLLASILESTLTDSELREAAQSLNEDATFSTDLAACIRACIAPEIKLEDQPGDQRKPELISATNAIMRAVKINKISKRDLLIAIESFWPAIATLPKDAPIRLIASTTAKRLSDSDIARLIEILAARPSETDEFLTGIMKRNEK